MRVAVGPAPARFVVRNLFVVFGHLSRSPTVVVQLEVEAVAVRRDDL